MFETNKAQIDYLTLTSYNERSKAAMYAWHNGVCEDPIEAHRMQYDGTITNDRFGSSFYGDGIQTGREHAMLQVSGSLAESAWNYLKSHVLAGHIRITRLDLQITVAYDRQVHSQSDLFADLRDAAPNRSISYLESKSGPQASKLATIYYGSRTSERFTRIYEKLGMGDEVLLRFEVEYKGKLARAIGVKMMEGASIKSLLHGELNRMPDNRVLQKLFGKPLSGSLVWTRVIREPGGTELWLKQKVLKCLDRYLAQHDEDSQAMAVLFQRVIEPYL